MNISERQKKRIENKVCIRQFRKALEEKIALRELEISNDTMWDYLYEIDLLFRQIGLQPNQKPTYQQCLRWKNEKVNEYGRKTLAKKIVPINLYLKLVCDSQKFIPQVKHITRAKNPTVLSREQIMEMIDFAEKKGKYTEAMMIFTTFITAGRKAVIHELRISDLDFKRNIITFRGCKGDLDLNVPISKTDMQRIKEYIDKHQPKPAPGHEDFLFLKNDGKQVYDQKLRLALKYCATQCGIKESVHPHTMRHSRIKDLRKQGYSWEEVMTVTGHQDITSLSTYIQEEDFTKVQEKLDNNQGHPKESNNDDPDKEVEILRLRLQLAEKERENLKMQLELNTHQEVQPISLNADRKGYA